MTHNAFSSFVVVFLIMTAIFGSLVLFTIYPEPDQCEHYQEMRQDYKDSNGEWGWPEYEAGMDEECGVKENV